MASKKKSSADKAWERKYAAELRRAKRSAAWRSQSELIAARKKHLNMRGLNGTPEEHLEYAAYLLKRGKAALRISSCSQAPELMFDAGLIMGHANSSGNTRLHALAAKHRDAVRARVRGCQRG